MNCGLCHSCCWWQPNQITVEQRDDAKYVCTNDEVGISTLGDFGCVRHMGPEATEMNVPMHTAKGTMLEPNLNPVDGPTEILIVTYWKDFPWLAYCLRCIQKHCSGFSGVTLALPGRDFEKLVKEVSPQVPDGPLRIRLKTFDEAPGKGMLHHMAMMASADLLVPAGTKYVLLHDSDGMFKMHSTPEHFFWEDKPYYLIRTWASLGVLDRRYPVARVASDCAMWKGPTDAQLGWDTEYYTMCVNTQVLPIEFFEPYREYLEKRHRQPFVQYMTSGKNDWPQSIMDHTAMGAWALKFMPERFRWFDVENGQPYPSDRKKAYHSHSGLLPNVVQEIEGFLK